MKFQYDISMPHTRTHTNTHTDKPKPIFPTLFQSWGNKNGLCHMTKLASMHIYGKTLTFKSPSLETKAYDLETWYAALGTQAL